jgi:carbamoyltransferase
MRKPRAVLRYLFHSASILAFGPREVTAQAAEPHMRRTLEDEGIRCGTVHFYDHHLCHAAAAYYFSPFSVTDKALAFTIDGCGDGHFSKLHLFHGTSRRRVGASRVNETGTDLISIGFMYANFLDALAPAGIAEEGNLTALAAYGEADATLYRELRETVIVTSERFEFDASRTLPFLDKPALAARARRIGDANFAATVQTWLENIVVEHLAMAREAHGVENLCIAGGVAANVAMNQHVYERAGFKRLFVFPAMGDEGIAAGSAALCAVNAGEDIRWLSAMTMPYFGHRVSRDEIESALRKHPSLVFEDLGPAWPERAAEAVALDRIIGVVSGRMEYGPRALGNRSILANPALAATRERINVRVKRRPAFQPCCPSILEEERERLFEASFPHKHMAIAFRMRDAFRAALAGAVHVDGTARAQFVERSDNPEFHRLLERLRELTGFGAAINTSFNLHGRAIVRTAEDAIRDFLDCGIDELYMEGIRVVRGI